MNFHTAAALLVLAALHGPAIPQEPGTPPGPAAAPLDALVGQWRAEGTYAPDADQPSRAWTATSEARWILDGHFVQEDVEVDVGAATTLQTRTLFGWDEARDRFVAISLDNLGRSSLVELSWSTATMLVAFSIEHVDGQPIVLRSAWEFGDGTYTHRVDRAAASGGWHRVVDGRFVRVDRLPERAAESRFGDAPIGAEMARLAPIAGTYSIEGEQVDADDYTGSELRGEDTVRAMFGGHVLAARIRMRSANGDQHEGERYVAWDPVGGSYDVYSIDDSGSVGVGKLRWDGESGLFGTKADTVTGTPGLVTTLIELDSGSLGRVVTRRIQASRQDTGRIEIRYRRKEGGK